MAKKKKVANLFSFLLPRLRRLSIQWPARQEVLKRIKIEVQDGFFKNGNPKINIRYKCEKCDKITTMDNIQIDHITPISNFAAHGSWDSYLNAMFCSSDKLQGICVNCHQEKSAKEASERAEKRKKIKNLLT